MSLRFTRRAAAVLLATGFAWNAAAQTFPSKVINVVVPYPAGGASDFVARQVQTEYQKQLGQTVVIENLGGVSGALGVQKVLAAPADGHSQVLATPMELVLAPLALSAVKFKPEDVRLAGMIGATSVIMLIRKDIPANTIDEFLAWAKGKEPSYGSVGPGSLYHLMGEKFSAMTNQKMLHVPYKGGGQLITDLAGGQVDMAFFPLAGPVPGMITDKRVKAIAIAAPQSHALFPDVPTMSSHKLLPEFNFDLWIGVQVPKATPEAAVARINQAMNETMKHPEVRKSMISTGSTVPAPMGVAELDKLYTTEVARYRALFKSINLQPQ